MSAERGGGEGEQREVGGVTCSVTCTWWLLGLAVKVPWGGISCPGCMDRLRKRYSHLVWDSFLAGKAAWALSGCLTTISADCCMVVNQSTWLSSRVCLLRLEVD